MNLLAYNFRLKIYAKNIFAISPKYSLFFNRVHGGCTRFPLLLLNKLAYRNIDILFTPGNLYSENSEENPSDDYSLNKLSGASLTQGLFRSTIYKVIQWTSIWMIWVNHRLQIKFCLEIKTCIQKNNILQNFYTFGFQLGLKNNNRTPLKQPIDLCLTSFIYKNYNRVSIWAFFGQH